MARRKPSDKTADRKTGEVVVPLRFDPPKRDETTFARADLVFEGVSHDSSSYDVYVFLNNPKANAETKHTAASGYAGKFSVFGHGGCYGEDGHCAIAGAPTGTSAAAIADAIPHPLTPLTKVVTVTDPLKKILKKGGGKLESVTLVPVRQAPHPDDRGPAAGLLSYKSMRLHTYA